MNSDNIVPICLIYYLWRSRKITTEKITKRKRSSKKRIWVRPIFLEAVRERQGAHSNLIEEMRLTDVDKYFNFLRMDPETFEKLLSLVGPTINRLYIHRKPLAASLRLALCLRYLASGDSMISMAYLFRVGASTVSNIIREVCVAIWEALKDTVFEKPTEEFWKKVSRGYNTRWNFPNCLGAIDGKHVVIQAPHHSGSVFYNYKQTHSVVLLAVCDAVYNFIMVDAGFEGRESDGVFFRRSKIGRGFETLSISVPPPSDVSEQGRTLPYVLVGDEAFPLSRYLMRPYPGRYGLNLEQRVYNYRLSRARRMIENTFGLWVARWRIYHRPINASLETVDAIVKATLCLHNYIKQEELSKGDQKYFTPTIVDSELADGGIQPGEWRNANNLGVQNIPYRLGTRNHSRLANEYRTEFAEYFMEEGRVAWQWERINC